MRWNRQSLTEVLTENIYVFASDEDVCKVRMFLDEIEDKGFSKTYFHVKGTFDKDIIFRISGDEFVVVNTDTSKEDFDGKVKDIFRILGDSSVASIGYMWNTEVSDLKQSIYKTERLMMIQKQKYYVEAEFNKTKRHPVILDSLIKYVNNGRFTVYLQPKANMNSDVVIGAEALIRKIDEDGRIIPPFEFVPLLEKTLLISRIDFFVLEEVCKIQRR